jgi:hypothetical protein
VVAGEPNTCGLCTNSRLAREDEDMAQRIQSGSSLKNSASVDIYFPVRYIGRPTVIISSRWEGSAGGVGHVDTITDIDNDRFRVVSGNRAPNYFVEWVAIGEV